MDNWADIEFSSINLGDIRLNKRGVHLLNLFGHTPGDRISTVLRTWGEIKACYRFFSNPRLSPEKILAPHTKATINRMAAHPVVLLPNDTTSIDYTTKHSIEGLGRLTANQCGENYGIFIHATLAITPERLNLGILGVKMWTRDLEKKHQTRYAKKNRPVEEKEIYRWIESYELACNLARQLPNTQIVNMTDREGDFTDLFSVVNERKKEEKKCAEIIVRSCQNRALIEKDSATNQCKKLYKVVNNTPALGTIEFILPKTQEREQRLVKQTIKSATIIFRGTKNRKIKINAVMAVEENAAEGHEPLCWIFLTTLPVKAYEEAIKVIEYYLCRWEIEVFIKILKSGCKVEEKQLQSAQRLKTLIAFFLVLAWRIQYVMMIGRICPNISSGDVFEESEWKAVYRIVNRNQPIPKDPPLLKDLIIMIASLGGYIGRANDPPPGPKVMWKGLSRMNDFALAWEAFVDTGERCG